MNLNELKILLVEDNILQVKIIHAFLVDSGVSPTRIDTTSSIAETGAIFSDHDIVLLDLNLEDSQGIDTIKQTAKIAPGVPIIVLTATDSDDIESLRAGAQDFIPKKELSSSFLERAIRYAIERGRLHRNLAEASAKQKKADDLKNIFIGMVAHDLRNPLSQISGFTEIVIDELEDKVDERVLG